MTINQLKTLIKNRLSSISDLQEIVEYEKTTFDGFPALTIVCSENENDYYTNNENERIFAFRLIVYEQIGNDITSDPAKKRAEEIVGDLVSDILDSLDNYSKSTDWGDGWLEAIPSRWGYAQIGEGWARYAEITVRVHQLFSLS